MIAREMCQRYDKKTSQQIQSVFVVVCCFAVSPVSWSDGQRINLPTRVSQQQPDISVKVSTSIVQSASNGPALVASISGRNDQQVTRLTLPQETQSNSSSCSRVIDMARRLTFSNNDALPDYYPNNRDNNRAQHYYPSSNRNNDHHHGQQIYHRPLKFETSFSNITDQIRMPNAGGRIIDLSRSTAPLIASGYKQSITTSLNFSPDIRYVIPYISSQSKSQPHSTHLNPGDSNYASEVTTMTMARSNINNNNNHHRLGVLANQQINNLNELMYINKLKQSQLQCQRRGFVGLIKTAKSFLSDGLMASTSELTRRATSPGNLLFGSAGLIAAAIPLAVYLMPDGVGSAIVNNGKRSNGGASSGDGLSSYSTIALDNGSTISTTYMPILSKLSLQGRVENMMGWIERSIEHLPSFPRLHPQECVKRSICEAYNDPGRYGVVGFALRLLFPATNTTVTDRMDDMEYKVINKYRHAAGFGLSRRIENNGTANVAICREKYEDCLISLLDLTEKLIELFTSNSGSIGSISDSGSNNGIEF